MHNYPRWFIHSQRGMLPLPSKKTDTYNFSDVIEIFQGALIFLDSLFYSHIFWSVRRLNYHLVHNENFLSMPQDLINSEKKEIMFTSYSFFSYNFYQNLNHLGETISQKKSHDYIKLWFVWDWNIQVKVKLLKISTNQNQIEILQF